MYKFIGQINNFSEIGKFYVTAYKTILKVFGNKTAFIESTDAASTH